ncbi:MAG: 2-amino-4-hydroxy-6-hydroxymethyldihydropteridine diphosphokinase [Azospirillaceae bacterium]|nr:2-amino-4-hydroxy-6-hydroxymethyldihydropteridine diphosphokinase [Azospirillaceae bacterium]
MVLVALGSNLGHAGFGSPLATCQAAVAALIERGTSVLALSRWYRTAPVPASDQPWYVNGVALVDSALGPDALLERLHAIEAAFGRVRRERNEARCLDLDLLAWGDRIMPGPQAPILPHPRLHQRAFVLRPLLDIAPDWRHPLLGRSARELARELPPDQVTTVIADDGQA